MDSYFVSLDVVDCANRIREAVFDSVTGEEIDAYAITHPSGGRCIVLVFEKHYYRAGNRLTLTVTLDDFTGRTRVHCASGRACSASTGARRSPLRASSTTR